MRKRCFSYRCLVSTAPLPSLPCRSLTEEEAKRKEAGKTRGRDTLDHLDSEQPFLSPPGKTKWKRSACSLGRASDLVLILHLERNHGSGGFFYLSKRASAKTAQCCGSIEAKVKTNGIFGGLSLSKRGEGGL